MDVRLKDGDVYYTAAGETEYLCAAREAAQRACIAASVTKGSFLYNRSLGVDYAAITDTDRAAEKLDMLIKEASAGISGADVAVTGADPDETTAALSVTYENETITTEVDLDGNL